MEKINFKVSSFCDAGSCVQVSVTQHSVYVRSSKTPTIPALTFDTAEWKAFTAGVKNGEFDRPD